MRQIKVIFLSFLLLSILILLISLLIPSTSKVSRAINIKGNRQIVMSNVKDLNTWQKWHPALRDKNVLVDSNKVKLSYANYYMNVVKSNDSSIDLISVNPGGQQLPSTITIYDYNDSCTVNWYSNIKVRWYPWEKFRSIFYDNILGPALDSNLTALKVFIEK